MKGDLPDITNTVKLLWQLVNQLLNYPLHINHEKEGDKLFNFQVFDLMQLKVRFSTSLIWSGCSTFSIQFFYLIFLCPIATNLLYKAPQSHTIIFWNNLKASCHVQVIFSSILLSKTLLELAKKLLVLLFAI